MNLIRQPDSTKPYDKVTRVNKHCKNNESFYMRSFFKVTYVENRDRVQMLGCELSIIPKIIDNFLFDKEKQNS